MIAPLAKFIDWSVLQIAYAIVGLRPYAQAKMEIGGSARISEWAGLYPRRKRPVAN